MKLLITGGTGFIGSHLVRSFIARGDSVTITGTSRRRMQVPQCTWLEADTTQTGPWQSTAADADAVINLAGRTISKRWTRSYRQAIVDSRIMTTRNLVEALDGSRTAALVSASAVGYYGDRGDEFLSEESGAGNDFLARVSRRWEAEAAKAEEKGVRVVMARLGVVLGPEGGAMARMIPAFRSYAGGPLGGGQQWFSWLHMEDLIAAVHFVLETQDLRGTLNFCSPNPVRNRELARTLGRVLNRPAVLSTPAMVLRLVFGEMAGVLLASQRALPGRLSACGFQFRYPQLEDALRQIVDFHPADMTASA